MDDGSQETEMTVVVRWQQPNRESDDARLIVELEDAEGRKWDPEVSTVTITGFLPAGWPRGGALAFRRAINKR